MLTFLISSRGRFPRVVDANCVLMPLTNEKSAKKGASPG
jgi:hypothetical protein